MPANAGEIRVKLSAGEAEFIMQMKAASGSVKEFGTTARGETMAVRAGFELLKGDVTSSRLAVHSLMELFPGLGKAMNAAFSGIAIVAVIGLIYEAGKKVEEFFNKLSDGTKKSAEAFTTLNNKLHTTNDELRVSNDKLDNELAKLQGRPQNNLSLALDEARVFADKLAESLHKDVEEEVKLLELQKVGNISWLMGNAKDSDIQDLAAEYKTEMDKVTQKFQQQLHTATTKDQKDKILAAEAAELAHLRSPSHGNETFEMVIAQAIATSEADQEERTRVWNAINPKGKTPIPGWAIIAKRPADQTQRLSNLRQFQSNITSNEDLSSLTFGMKKKTEDVGAAKAMEAGNKQAQTELKTYTDERDKLNAKNFDNEIERIDAEYHKELDYINELHITKKQKAELLALAQVAYAKKKQEALDKQNDELNKSNEEVRKSLLGVAEAFNHQVVEAIKTGENEAHKFYEELHKALEDIQKIQSQAQSEQLTHNIEMVRSKGGTYRQELDLQYQDIMTRYNNSAKTAADALQANAEITKVNNEWTEALTKQRQETTESLKDEARNIIGGVSSQIGKAAFGDKTNFKQMFKGMGEQFVSTTLTKELTKAFRLDNRLGATQANPMWVKTDTEGMLAFPGMNKRQITTIVSPITAKFIPGMTPENDISSIINKRFKGGNAGMIPSPISEMIGQANPHSESWGEAFGLFKTASSVASQWSSEGLAGGGVIDGLRLVGEKGPELFAGHGSIIPNSKLGGMHIGEMNFYNAELGAENRIRRELETATQSAVYMSMNATADRARRIPERTS